MGEACSKFKEEVKKEVTITIDEQNFLSSNR